jgi:hypothetical protein
MPKLLFHDRRVNPYPDRDGLGELALSASRSIWNGVYTEAQAKRGEALFAERSRKLPWAVVGRR